MNTFSGLVQENAAFRRGFPVGSNPTDSLRKNRSERAVPTRERLGWRAQVAFPSLNFKRPFEVGDPAYKMEKPSAKCSRKVFGIEMGKEGKLRNEGRSGIDFCVSFG